MDGIDKAGRALRSLLLGYYEGGKLVFEARPGLDFDLQDRPHDLVTRLRKIERQLPFAAVPRDIPAWLHVGQSRAGRLGSIAFVGVFVGKPTQWDFLTS